MQNHLFMKGLLLVVGLGLAACSDPVTTPDASNDTSLAPDQQIQGDTELTSDTELIPDTELTLDAETPPDVTPPVGTDRVVLDLDTAFHPPGTGFVRARQAQSAEDLIPGEVAQGLPGDYLLENAHGRYLIGFGHRAVGACSWNGNPIETELISGGTSTGSVLGEICFLLNISQTVRPEHLEVIEDGSSGRAVIAVTGRVVPLDFLNLTTTVNSFAPGLADLLDFDPERPLPFRVTFYYVLHPESRSLRVLTALRNDGVADEYFVAVQLMLSGSTGGYFSPLGAKKGWGHNSLGPSNLVADPISFIGYFARHAGYAILPDPDPGLTDGLGDVLPAGAGMVAISGVVALAYSVTDVLPLVLTSQADWPTTQGMQHVPLNGVHTIGYRLYPSDGSVATAADLIYQDLGVETTAISGRVVDHTGAPSAGVRVSALKDGVRSFNMAWTDADGAFAMRVPRGTYTLRLRDDDVPTTIATVEATEATLALGDVAVIQPATLIISVQTPDGAPTPARVVIACAAACPALVYSSLERDSIFQAPGGWYRLIEVGVDGQATVALPPGEFRVAVNRGMTWSTWPADLNATGGEAITAIAGETVSLIAEIAKVVDTSGALGADFHVHAMASPDSQVSNRARVLDLMAGGLDVIVSTDHDAIADFAPAIAELGAGAQITSIVGCEITTSGLGHVNAFPLEPDPTARRGGPIDWSGDSEYHLSLEQLVDEIRAHPGEQVVQLNHPSTPMGAIGLLGVDVLTGQSFTVAEALRMAPTTPDPITGDTGLWSEGFDALELYNGFGVDDFWRYFRWSLAMIGRGFSPTGTAVTDTHGIYGSLGASPRSFVFVDEGADSPATLDVGHLVDRIRGGALIGTNGPFMRVEVQNTSGERAGLGDTLRVVDGTAVLRVKLEMPVWIDVDTVDVYINMPAEGLIGAPGVGLTTPLEPTTSVPVAWTADHRTLVAEGQTTHHRLRQVVDVPLTVTADSYVVVVAHGRVARTMRLVVGGSPAPMAFSNPIFIDTDGNGYDNPPLAAARAARLAGAGDKRLRQAEIDKAQRDRIIIPEGSRPTVEDLARLIDALSCKHGVEDAPHHHDHGGRGAIVPKSVPRGK